MILWEAVWLFVIFVDGFDNRVSLGGKGLSAEIARGIVSVGDWPVPWSKGICDWLGEIHLELPPHVSLPTSSLLGILASHQSRETPLTPWWELALESALRHARRSHRILFFSASAPYAGRLRHACERFGLPYLMLGQKEQLDAGAKDRIVIPRLLGNPLPNRADLMDSPLEDRAVAILSHQLFGLHVRPDGKVARLVEARLSEPSMAPGSTIVAVNERGLPSARQRTATLAWRLADQGAVLWFPSDGSNDLGSNRNVWMRVWGCERRGRSSTWMPFGRATPKLLTSNDYLIHFTRSRHGTWPDQSIEHLFDEAIRLEWTPQKSPLQTLRRILAKQRLVASSHLRRGALRTVCFTAQSIQTMLDRRGFQSHLGRWDWEPYGIAIRRTWLSEHGARPVRYLPSGDISHLSHKDQAFSQPLPKDDRHRDWSIEREWRVQDDIRLCQIPADQGFVFVHRRSEASSLSSLSRWPIVYLSSEETP